jgi:hypothetical protein
MNRASLDRFAARAAAQRTALFGVEFLYGSRRFCGQLNAVTTARSLESGGWSPTVTATLRVARPELVRAGLTTFPLGALLTRGTSASYRVEEIRDNPSAPEIVLGLAYDPTA